MRRRAANNRLYRSSLVFPTTTEDLEKISAMSTQELDSFASAVASISLETNLLTPELIEILKNAIENNLSVAEAIGSALKTV